MRPVLPAIVLAVVASLLTAPDCAASAISFDFGISPTIDVTQNVVVPIPAAIINRGSDPLVFGCALVSCGGLDFGASVTAPFGEGLDALQFSFTSSFYPQFVGLVLQPNQRFDFLFGTIDFDPSVSVGNPFGTVLHPIFGFRIDDAFASVPVTITAGDHTSFAPPIFAPSSSSSVVPEPSTFLLLATGVASLGMKRRLRVKT